MVSEMALEKKYYSGEQVFDIIKELPYKDFLSLLNTFGKERGADVVEVVRCKDCVWYDEKRPYSSGHALYECRNLERFLPPDFFCKDGERREDV